MDVHALPLFCNDQFKVKNIRDAFKPCDEHEQDSNATLLLHLGIHDTVWECDIGKTKKTNPGVPINRFLFLDLCASSHIFSAALAHLKHNENRDRDRKKRQLFILSHFHPSIEAGAQPRLIKRNAWTASKFFTVVTYEAVCSDKPAS